MPPAFLRCFSPLVFAASLFTGPAPSEALAQESPPPLSLKRGDVLVLEIESTKQIASASRHFSKQLLERERFEVIDATLSGYVVRWTHTPIESTAANDDERVVVGASDRALSRETFVIELDRDGFPVHIRDWRMKLQRAAHAAGEELRATASEKHARMAEMLFSVMLRADDKTAATRMAEHLWLLAAWRSVTHSLGEVSPTLAVEPNPFAGRPIQMTTTLRPRDHDDRIVIETDAVATPAGGDALLDAFFSLTPNAAAQRSRIEARFDTTPEYRISRLFEIDPIIGIPTHVAEARTQAIGSRSRTTVRKTVTIRLE